MDIVWRTTRSLDKGSRNFEVQIAKPPAADVTLVTSSERPVGTMCSAANAYNGVFTDNFPVEDFDLMLNDIMNTKLATPLEMIHFVWLIKNVTRAFTHQLVRYRIGTAYIQESMRFYGQKPVYTVLGTGLVVKDDRNLTVYGQGVASVITDYEYMVTKGVPSQDARGILPTNILTNIFFDCSLRTLQNIFNQRMCCQAQHPEWLPVLLQMRKLLALEHGEKFNELLAAPIERNEPCGYNASFDRPCSWKMGQKIDENEVIRHI